jgi:flavin reductase (DIM6/NTAB) family NADH-FMN oxidoreductase RutF
MLMDVRGFWQLIGNRAVGAAVVASSDQDGPAGFFALSPTHVCASPPTVMVSIDSKTSALATIRKSRRFSINYLPLGSEAMVADFSGRTERKGADRFSDEAWTTLSTGAPVLRGAVASLDCSLEEIIERHNTALAFGAIVDSLVNADVSPLVSFRGGFRPLG